MKIPNNTVSPTQLRTYGSADIRTEDHEEDKGCPRRWKAKYVDDIQETEPSYALSYGSMFHRVMERIVAADCDPREAVLQAIGTDASLEMVDELLTDLETYLARPASDTDDMAVLGTEVDLRHVLYDDPDHGTVNFRAILDWIGIDPEDPGIIHVKDYKSNRSPVSNNDLKGDVQLRGQAWLARKFARRWTNVPNPRVIVHLDLVKFRDYVYEYSDDELDAWETWASAMVRTILLDEKATPVLNANCSSCIVRHDCPALLKAPKWAATLAAREINAKDLEKGRAWRDEANAARLLLEKAVKVWDERFAVQVARSGPVTIGGKTYAMEPQEVTRIDVFAIARVLGADFPKVATVSKASIERATITESAKAQALAQFHSEINGQRLAARKAET